MPSPSLLFPITIKDLTYVKTLHSKPVRQEYSFALYSSSTGKEYVCKLWSGKTKGQSWKDLVNEIAVYKAFAALSKSAHKKLATNFPNTYVPKLYTSSTTDTLVYLVIEKVEGTLLRKSSTTKQSLTVYAETISYFKQLSDSTAFVRSIPEHRTASQLLLFFHAVALRVGQRFPSLIPLTLQSIIAVYKGMWAMAQDKNVSFVHRDLGGYNNILVQGNKYSVIDFQLACLTHPLVEVTNILASRKKDLSFTKGFFASDLWTDIKQDAQQVSIFRALLIYAAMLNVATDDVEETKMSVDLVRRALAL